MTIARLDPTAPRKKHALDRWVRRYNERNPARAIHRPHGFNPDTPRIGTAARSYLKLMQHATGLQVTGIFNEPTMLRLFPPGLRSKVMALAHAELGEHEWPAGSNAGPVLEYLRAAGINVGAPWCASFVTWVLKHRGFTRFPGNPAYVPSWLAFAKTHDLLKPHDKSHYGDLWIWNWDGGLADHIGFCDEGVKGSTAYYLDGNVGNFGGQVTDAARPESGIAAVVDLIKLSRLK